MKKIKYILLGVGVFAFVLVIITLKDYLNLSIENEVVRADSYTYKAEGPLEELQLLETLRMDRTPRGLEVLKELTSKDNAIGYYANIILAERYEEMGEEHSFFYRNALRLFSTAEIQNRLGRAFMAEGSLEEATKHYISLLPSEAAIRALEEIGLNKKEIAALLVEGKNWTAAQQYIEENMMADDGKIELDAKRMYGMVLAATQQYREAIRLINEILPNYPEDEELLWWLAGSFAGVEENNKAIEIYKALGKRGSYNLGLLLDRNNQKDEAIKAFINGEVDVGLWRGARMLEDKNRTTEAFEVYKRLATMQGSYREDAAYRAYIIHKQLKKPLEEDILEILKSSPAWSHAIGKSPNWPQLEEVEVGMPEFLVRYNIFLEAGKTDIANLELAIGERLANNQEKLALGDYYLKQGMYHRAVIWGIRALREKPTLQAYKLAYQKPYEDFVIAAAEEFNLDPYLIWAVMREESHYRWEVLSRAGAVGLMQIMPATGKDIAARLKVDFDESLLLDPEVNIRFGAFYIRRMLNMFNDNLDKALAAYNGGSGNVRRWSGTKLGSTPEGFPTSITFLETRRYITKVKNSYLTYKWIYEKDN